MVKSLRKVFSFLKSVLLSLLVVVSMCKVLSCRITRLVLLVRVVAEADSKISKISRPKVCSFCFRNTRMLILFRRIKDRSSFATDASEFGYHSWRYTILLISCR